MSVVIQTVRVKENPQRLIIAKGKSSTTEGVQSVNGDVGPNVVLDAADVGAAPTVHTHDTSAVVSGTFNIARIPTGTSGSTVAFGDHLHTGVYDPAGTAVSEIPKFGGISTGLIKGGALSVASSTQVNLTALEGVVADYVTNPLSPVITKVVLPPQVITVTNLVQPLTWLLVDAAGTFLQQTTNPTDVQRRTHIVIGGISVVMGNVVSARTLPQYLPQGNNQLYDLIDALGPFNIQGNILSPGGANMTLAKTTGSVFSKSFNLYVGGSITNDPHVCAVPALNPVGMRYITQVFTPTPSPLVTNVDPANYDVGGVITPIPGGANVSTIQRVFIIPPGSGTTQVLVQYGQTTYQSLDAAVAAVGSEQFNQNPFLPFAVLIGYIVVKKTAINLSDPSQAKVLQAAKLSGNAAGSGGTGSSGTDFWVDYWRGVYSAGSTYFLNQVVRSTNAKGMYRCKVLSSLGVTPPSFLPGVNQQFYQPTVPPAHDGSATPLTIGLRFTPLVNGQVNGAWFYKGAGNTGTHVARLWVDSGSVLIGGPTTFVGETASGWQFQAFPAPIAVTAGTTYVIGVDCPNGNYEFHSQFFAAGTVVRGQLTGNIGLFTTTVGSKPDTAFGNNYYSGEPDFTTATPSPDNWEIMVLAP